MRLKRVMFVHGYTEAEALAYLRGHNDGRDAEWQAINRGKTLSSQKVGGRAWEAQYHHSSEVTSRA